MILLECCVLIDKDTKFTNFDSSIHSLMPEAITKMANESRRDSGYRLISRCVRHVTDLGHAPKRISDVKIIKMSYQHVAYVTQGHTLFVWSHEPLHTPSHG